MKGVTSVDTCVRFAALRGGALLFSREMAANKSSTRCGCRVGGSASGQNMMGRSSLCRPHTTVVMMVAVCLVVQAATPGWLGGAVLAEGVGDSPPHATLVDHPIASGMEPTYLDGSEWTLRQAFPEPPPKGSPPPPPPRGPISASVPGDVLTDLQKGGVTPDPYFNVTWTDPAFVAIWNTGTWT